ncbi:MAG TPA: hypothetical protein VK071_13005 [Tissierellales bacterium]|nr:hypothetical protein [Tissierellales bacterium]
MSENRIDIKILSTEDKNKLIPVIREHSSKSISEIRRDINECSPILTLYYIDNPEGLSLLSSAIKELERKGAKLEIIQKIGNLSRVISSSTIENLIDRDKLITEQIQQYDDKISD